MPTSEQYSAALSTEHLRTDLKGRSVRGGFLTLTSQGAQFIIQTVATVMLARLLTPADFGLVAMVTAVTGLATAFAAFGLSEATIQREDITHEQVSTLFWINVGIGLALMLLTVAAAPLLVWLYKEPRLKNITFLLSFLFLMNGLRVQHEALLKRQMRYVSLAIRDVTALALSVPLAILMAYKGAGYWALVTVPLAGTFIQVILSWLMVRWLPGLPRRNAKVGSLIVFGGNVALSNIISYLDQNADNVLIGWYWGAAPLGLYSKAYNLLMLPVRQLSNPAAGVAIPAFSRLQGEPERFARYYLHAIKLIVWISAPVFGFLFVAANPVIVLVLGAKWEKAAPVFQILVISALGQLLLNSTVWLLVSKGQSSQLCKLLLGISPIIVSSFVVGLPFGIKGVALSGSLVLLIMLPGILKFAFRGTNLSLARVGSAVAFPLLPCFAGVFFVELALHFVRPEHIASQLVVATLGFAVAYLLSILIPAVRKEVLSFRKLFGELRLSKQTI